MPANLPPMYFEAEKRFRDGKTPEEKVEEQRAERKTFVPLLTARRCIPIFLPYR
jgi:hypothetical protein